MKTFKLQFKSIALILSILILFQGCTVYMSTPITLEQASKAEQKVKVITESKEKLIFKRIGVENDTYYGVKKRKGEIVRTPLDSKWVSEVKVKDKAMSTILTIALPVGIIVGIAIIIGDQSYNIDFSDSDFQW